MKISNGYDNLHRRSSMGAVLGATTLAQQGMGYDAAGRLGTVTSGTHTFTYQYDPVRGLANGVTFNNPESIGAGGSGNVLTTSRTYDNLRRLAATASATAATTVTSHGYSLNNLNQRTRDDREDGTHWGYGYDGRGQVTSGQKYLDATIGLNGYQFGYGFDDIGNRTNTVTNGRTANYSPNNLNQYTSRGVPGALDVVGLDDPAATITVNSLAATRQNEWFYKELTLQNTASPVHLLVDVTSTLAGAGPGGSDLVTQDVSEHLVAKTPEVFGYDDDGNTTLDGKWNYTWDGENRLIAMESNAASIAAGAPQLKLLFDYDGQSRRVRKRVFNWNSTTNGYELTSTRKFVWNGWLLVAEMDASNTVVHSYAYGNDLSGSMEGAGGVGGVLSLTDSTAAYYYSYDGNGNVMGLVKSSDGSTAAEYEYGPFGEVIQSSGPMADENPFRFSTKYQDENGLVYYGYRYYNAGKGRWLSRDPTGEEGGLNLFGLVTNNPVSDVDSLGLAARWYTRGFDADAYGIVPWSLSVGYTWTFIGAAVGASVEAVYNCRDGSAEAFASAMVGVGFGTPGISVSSTKGLNYIYNLPTATGYKGEFFAVTLSAGFGGGGYGTGFTNRAGLRNLLKTGGFGSEIYGFGAGVGSFSPSASLLFQWQYFWDLGSLPFSTADRAKYCRCVSTPGTVPNDLIQKAADDSKRYEGALRSKITGDTAAKGFPGGFNQTLNAAHLQSRQ